MPRTKMDRLSRNQDTYQRMVNRTIRAAMVRSDYAHNKELAQALGISETQISNRFKKGWSTYELFRIGQTLGFTDAEAARLLGVPR